MRSLRITLGLVILLAFAGRLYAQAGATGTVLGTVTDSTGAIIPNVKVTVTNTKTNLAVHTVTSSSGDYLAPALNPGTYSFQPNQRASKNPSPAPFHSRSTRRYVSIWH